MSKRKKFFRSWQFWVLTFSVLALTTILTGIWAYRQFKVAEAEKDANFCVALLETVKKNREMPFSDSLERRLDTAIVRIEQKKYIHYSLKALGRFIKATQLANKIDFDGSLNELQLAERWLNKMKKGADTNLGDVLNFYAVIYQKQGRYDESFEFLRRAGQFYGDNKNPTRAMLVHANMALNFNLWAMPDSAIVQARKANELYKKKWIKNYEHKLTLASALNHLAGAYVIKGEQLLAIGDSAGAFRNFRFALDTINVALKYKPTLVKHNNHVELGTIESKKGLCSIRLAQSGRVNEAIGLLQSAANHFSQSGYAGAQPGNAIVQFHLAEALAIAGRFDEACQALNTGFEILGYPQTLMEGATSCGQVLPPSILVNLKWKHFRIEGLMSSARIQQLIAKKLPEAQRLSAQKKAYQALIASIDLLDSLRINMPTDASATAMGMRYGIVFSEAAALSADLYELSCETQYIRQFYYFTEQSRGFLLRQSLYRKSKSDSYTGIRKKLFEQESWYRKRINVLELKLEKGIGDEAILIDSLFKIKRAYVNFSNSLYQNKNYEYRSYYNDRFQKQLPDIDQIRKSLSDNDVLVVQYMQGKGELLGLAFNKTDHQLFRIPLSPSFYAVLHDVREALQGHTSSDYADNAYLLYEYLLKQALEAPIGRQAKRLIIAPDAILNGLAFDALLTQRPINKTDYLALPYVFQQYAISYSYSISSNLLNASHDRPGAPKTPLKAGIFVAKYPSGQYLNLDSLGAGAEKIALFMDQAPFTPAHKQDFIRASVQFDLLHLVMHGIAEGDDALTYHLVFSPESSDQPESQFTLSVGEIYNMSLPRTRLVVMGSCQTQAGIMQAGEGVLSIARAFAYAGCPGMVANLNKIADRPAAILMAAFYDGLQKGLPKDAAMAQAKKSLLLHPVFQDKLYKNNYSAPHNWVNMIVIGDTAPIN